MGSVTHGIPRDLCVALKAATGIKSFVETGTNAGCTAAWAASEFDKVFTIEADELLHGQAGARLCVHPNVTVALGNSPQILFNLAHELPCSIFWLDAHWGGDGNARIDTECPVLREIHALNTRREPDVILVDDARLFLRPPMPPHNPEEWPDAAAVFWALNDSGRRYVVVVDDVIVAVPMIYRRFLVNHLRR